MKETGQSLKKISNSSMNINDSLRKGIRAVYGLFQAETARRNQ